MRVRRIVIAGTAAMAMSGVLGMAPAAWASSAPVPAWTQQHPAASPPARRDAAIAYDAATGTVVLFGGNSTQSHSNLGDTWTWDGTTWTQQHPAASPPVREGAPMAYDAATRTVVLFGGFNKHHWLGDTWTWNGTTWARQHPATSPPVREDASMAYDAATGTVVLFGGIHNDQFQLLADTWTWDGTTWTRQHPAAHPQQRAYAAMAYDAAGGTVVLFGGLGHAAIFGDTWTWDGTTWTKQAPATSPPARSDAAMAYDAATGTAVLFGGCCSTPDGGSFAGTQTWDGTTWASQHPATHPPGRDDPAMAYDAATGTVVLFGGWSVSHHIFGDTWTWGSP